MPFTSGRRLRLGFLGATLLAAPAALAADVILAPETIVDRKSVFGQVEARDVATARARIGGTLTELSVTQGSSVEAGQVIGRVVDEKLNLQLQSADARIQALQSQIANAKQEADRATALVARGDATQQRLDQTRTQVDVLQNQIAAAEADRAVVARQASEGDVVAPAAGRVLTAPIARGSVVLPGDAVVTIGGGGFFLRLSLPEREALRLAVGQAVDVGDPAASVAHPGKIDKIYPLIDAGRVQADVVVEGTGDFFVGRRVPVTISVGERTAFVVPDTALRSRAGIDFVTIRRGGAMQETPVIVGEALPGGRSEVLTGLKAGDVIVSP